MNYPNKNTYNFQDPDIETGELNLMGVDALIGNEVVNPAGEELGHIKELIFDVRTGQIVYAVMWPENITSRDEKLFAVPWQALTLDTINNRCVLNVAKERLKLALGFNNSDWPDMSDQAWQEQVKQFYDTGAASESRQ
jgi:sporulation protein YlmC with PRC-barrel domain